MLLLLAGGRGAAREQLTSLTLDLIRHSTQWGVFAGASLFGVDNLSDFNFIVDDLHCDWLGLAPGCKTWGGAYLVVGQDVKDDGQATMEVVE